MTFITIEDAQAKLPELIGGLAKGQELLITQEGRIVGERSDSRRRRVAGFSKDMMTIVAEDEDHLADFAEYMP